MDITQREMLRRIVGWRRTANEDWYSTMARMQSRMEAANGLYS